MRRCLDCMSTGPFHANPANKDGKASYCKPCANKRARDNHAKNRQSRNAGAQARYIRRKFGLSCEDYYSRLAASGGVCEICSEALTVPNLDHCHTTGKVRGVLCNPCNQGIGYLKDSPERLRAAAIYLEKYHE